MIEPIEGPGFVALFRDLCSIPEPAPRGIERLVGGNATRGELCGPKLDVQPHLLIQVARLVSALQQIAQAPEDFANLHTAVFLSRLKPAGRFARSRASRDGSAQSPDSAACAHEQ